jgi:hypothetical protein
MLCVLVLAAVVALAHETHQAHLKLGELVAVAVLFPLVC